LPISSNGKVEERKVTTTPPTPFLKWAGGKRGLLTQILEFVPDDVDTYYEPFLGAGSLFFAMPSEVVKIVSDFNPNLILTYQAIKDDVDGVLRELKKRTNTKEDYLEVRAWDRSPKYSSRTPASKAARFIFLNKCGFNGLYRVNSKGQYNVPYGNPKTVDFIQENNLRAVSEFLNQKNKKKPTVKLSTGDYKEILREAEGYSSLVYLDPPYHPQSETANFVSYNENGFTAENQVELHDEIVRLTYLGVRVLLSNSDTPFIRDLYSEEIFNINTLSVRRAIAAKKASRGVITEVLIDNYNFLRGKNDKKQ
jgi:DNA adenine methylase